MNAPTPVMLIRKIRQARASEEYCFATGNLASPLGA